MSFIGTNHGTYTISTTAHAYAITRPPAWKVSPIFYRCTRMEGNEKINTMVKTTMLKTCHRQEESNCWQHPNGRITGEKMNIYHSSTPATDHAVNTTTPLPVPTQVPTPTPLFADPNNFQAPQAPQALQAQGSSQTGHRSRIQIPHVHKQNHIFLCHV
jgi:hypothetical protein